MPRSSNKTNGNGATQPRNTQRRVPKSQNRRRSSQATQVEPEEDIEMEDEQQPGTDDENADEEKGGAQDDVTRKSNALVRLALFNEYRRTPLRRDDINKKVLGQNTRMFASVFEKAQSILRDTFGMQLVELMTRTELQREQNENDETVGEVNATGLRKKATAQGSKTYILRSILDSRLIELAAASDEHISEQEKIDIPEEDEDEYHFNNYGSIISWSSADQLGPLGILYVILALILISGGVLSDMDLKKYLKSFRLETGQMVQFSAASAQNTMPIDQYLSQLFRQHYLDKQRVATGAGGAPRPTQGKRGRQSAVNDENANYEWRWGPRSRAEVGETSIARFVGEFMVERAFRENDVDEDEDDEAEGSGVQQQRGNGRNNDANGRNNTRRDRAKDKEKLLEGIIKDITRAMGGKLKDVKTI